MLATRTGRWRAIADAAGECRTAPLVRSFRYGRDASSMFRSQRDRVHYSETDLQQAHNQSSSEVRSDGVSGII